MAANGDPIAVTSHQPMSVRANETPNGPGVRTDLEATAVPCRCLQRQPPLRAIMTPWGARSEPRLPDHDPPRPRRASMPLPLIDCRPARSTSPALTPWNATTEKRGG